MPDWHTSMPSQMSPSLHEAPLVTEVWKQPLVGLQRSTVQKLLSLQTSGVPAVHTPTWHVSLPLHRFPSLQDAPFASTVCWHPVVRLQESVVQELLSLQLSGVP